MKWAGHVARIKERTGEERCIQDFGGERRHLEYLGLHGGVILKWIFKKLNGEIDWIDLSPW